MFGKNVACYKFALAHALLDLAPNNNSIITLEKLAEPYARYTLEHLDKCDSQAQNSPTSFPFLEACRQYNRDEITYNQLIETTVRKGFEVVLDKFHNVNRGSLPVQFYEKQKGQIILTDEIFKLTESCHYDNFRSEVESRWNLVEQSWNLGISRNLLVSYDGDNEWFYWNKPNYHRVDLTSSRNALNGYQKGKCFYCFRDISVVTSTNDLAEVDHFFPHFLANYGIASPIDGVWNLVLACKTCNRGKSNHLPQTRFLERLFNRNKFLIGSHHPLRQTITAQAGKKMDKMRCFLNQNYNEANIGPCVNSQWEPGFEYPATF